MLQFSHPGPPPTLDDVRATFGLDDGDVDEEYGVAATDARAGLYVVRIDPAAADKVRSALAARPAGAAEGLFGDPRVEPFGRPGGS